MLSPVNGEVVAKRGKAFWKGPGVHGGGGPTWESGPSSTVPLGSLLLSLFLAASSPPCHHGFICSVCCDPSPARLGFQPFVS